MSSIFERARSITLRFVAIALVLSLLSNSTPAAPQIVVSLAKEESTTLSFWYNSGGLGRLVQGFRATPRTPKTQTNRKAKEAQHKNKPNNKTIDLIERGRFAAVAYDSEGNAIGGVK